MYEAMSDVPMAGENQHKSRPSRDHGRNSGSAFAYYFFDIIK